jgi:hypothetical protein
VKEDQNFQAAQPFLYTRGEAGRASCAEVLVLYKHRVEDTVVLLGVVAQPALPCLRQVELVRSTGK